MADRPNISELIDIVVLKAKVLGWEEDQGSSKSHLEAEADYVAARQRLDVALKPLLERA